MDGGEGERASESMSEEKLREEGGREGKGGEGMDEERSGRSGRRGRGGEELGCACRSCRFIAASIASTVRPSCGARGMPERRCACEKARHFTPAAKGTGRGGWDGVGLDEGQAHHEWQLYHDERALTRSCEPLDEVYVGQRAQPHAVDEDEGRA